MEVGVIAGTGESLKLDAAAAAAVAGIVIVRALALGTVPLETPAECLRWAPASMDIVDRVVSDEGELPSIEAERLGTRLSCWKRQIRSRRHTSAEGIFSWGRGGERSSEAYHL